MLNQKYSKLIVVLMLALTVVAAACAGQTATRPEPAPALVVEEAAPVQAPVAEEAVAEAVPAAEFDLVVAVDHYLTHLPEGFLAIGQVDAFKEVLTSGQVVLIDVREVAEYEAGHIPGAVNIPLRTLAQNLDKVPADQPVVVYCKSGYRAAVATSALQMLGYENVRAFAPSYQGWADAGEAVITEPVMAQTFPVPEIAPEMIAAVDNFLSTMPEDYLAMGDIEKLNEAIANGAFLLDVRETAEFGEGHLPDAVNIPIRTLAQHLSQIPTDRPVFVYCKSGHRAALSLAALQTLGYQNVKAFPPGFAGWSAAGQPVALAR
jgi:rhodanese-related sulfurtransferase